MGPPSMGLVSSGQMSALSLAISTNSRAKIFFTTFGGRVAAGLYGPRLWSDCRLVTPSVDIIGCSPSAVLCCWAAEASTSRPEVAPPVGLKVGTAGSWVGCGMTLSPG